MILIRYLHTSRAPDRDIFSDPAKSTRFSLPHLMRSSSPTAASLTKIVMEKTEWERLQQRNEVKKRVRGFHNFTIHYQHQSNKEETQPAALV